MEIWLWGGIGNLVRIHLSRARDGVRDTGVSLQSGESEVEAGEGGRMNKVERDWSWINRHFVL